MKTRLAGVAAALLVLVATPAGGMTGDLLDPEDAFAFDAHLADADTIVAEWRIADGYYLYRDQIGFEVADDGITLGDPRLPDGERTEDEFFGRVETYRDRLVVEVPVQRDADAPDTVELTAHSQGCADAGVCYPPQQDTAVLDWRDGAAGDPAAGLDQLRADVGLDDWDDAFLDPDEAFQLSVGIADPRTLIVTWDIAEGYYLYRDRIEVHIDGGGAVRAGAPVLPEGRVVEDEFFGRSEIYDDELTLRVPLERDDPASTGIVVQATYQGCAEAGLCYAPITRAVSLQLPGDNGAPGEAARNVPEQDRIAAVLMDGGMWLAAATFFGFGLLLAFTPCVLPMVPILSNLVVGAGGRLGTRRAFTVSLAFVLAMAATYTLAGILAGLAGANLQAAFQQPWVIGVLVAVFVALALSMFGFYELQIPSALQTRMSRLSNRQRGGSLVGASAMGLISALVVGPCITPPLVGALIYIGQTGDAVLGGVALLSMSLGMGVPLLAFGASAGRLLPRAGRWMETIKAVFGVLMLGVAIWLLERVVPAALAMVLWAALFIVTGVFMGALSPLGRDAGRWRLLSKGLGLVVVVYGVVLIVGAAGGGKDPWQPLRGAYFNGESAPELEFRKVGSVDEVEQHLRQAAADGQRVLLEFYADWCVDCVRMERTTFRDAEVRHALDGMVLLKADVTDNTSAHRALLQHYDLYGPPAMLFFGADGRERRDYRAVGYLGADRFVDHLEAALGD